MAAGRDFWNNLHQISLEKLVETFLFRDIPSPPLPQSSFSSHNCVYRISGGTIQGGLFFTEDYSVGRKGYEFDLYVASRDYTADQVRSLLEQAVQGGYPRFIIELY
jgi:hypothetical protein